MNSSSRTPPAATPSRTRPTMTRIPIARPIPRTIQGRISERIRVVYLGCVTVRPAEDAVRDHPAPCVRRGSALQSSINRRRRVAAPGHRRHRRHRRHRAGQAAGRVGPMAGPSVARAWASAWAGSTRRPAARPMTTRPRSTPCASRAGRRHRCHDEPARASPATSARQARGPSSALTGSTRQPPHIPRYSSPSSSTAPRRPGCVPAMNHSLTVSRVHGPGRPPVHASIRLETTSSGRLNVVTGQSRV